MRWVVIAICLAACNPAAQSGASQSPPGSPAGASTSPSANASASPPSSPTASPWQPQTAWERAIEKIGSDGHFDLPSALELFATAFGRLPGVDKQQDLTGVDDRTIAVQAVMAHADELTDEQRKAVDDYIKPPADSIKLTSRPLRLTANEARLAVVSDGVKQAIIESINDARATIAGKLGRDLAGDINVHFKENPGGETKILGQAWSDWPGGVMGDCDITIFAAASSQEPGFWLSTASHEVFHCFQFDGYRTMEALQAAPGWVIEGQASWVGEKLTSGISTTKLRAWDRYLTIPYRPLTTRTYDAIGFYAHLEETGTDPWSIFRPMWNAGADNIAIFNAANASTDVFLDSWASGVLRQPNRGQAWTTTGPGISDAVYNPSISDLGDGDVVDLSAPFFTNDIRYIAVGSDMIHVRVEGHGRLSDGSLDTTQLGDVWFCVEGHTCTKKCPDAPEPPATAGEVSNFVTIASSGGIDGTIGAAEGKDLEDDCATPTPSSTPDEFCSRYRDYINWAKANQTDTITKELATEIASRFAAMAPFAPAELAADVNLMVSVYSTYAGVPPPYDIPAVGPGAAGIADALTAMNAYCHVTF
jgi:hypothetical protein